MKELQDMSILIEAAKGVAVPAFYREFAMFLLNHADRDEMKWYQWHGSEAAWEHRCIGMWWPEIVTRIMMHDMTILRKDLQFQESTKLVYLELIRVEKVEELNLYGLWFLRALMVRQCKDLKKIDSRCSWLKCHDRTFLGLNVETESRCMGNLRFVELEDLPNLESLSFASHSRLESVWMHDCPKAFGAWYLSSTCTSLKRLVLPMGFSDNMLIQSKQLDKDLADGQLFMRLTELVLQRGDRFVIEEKLAKYFLKSMMEAENLEVLDIGQVIPASIIGRMDSINVSKLVHLTILDLSRAKMRRIEELCKLRHLGALGLYGCTELLELPDLDIFPKLNRLCINRCYKLANTLSKEKVPHTLLGFHALGFGWVYGNCKVCMLFFKAIVF